MHAAVWRGRNAGKAMRCQIFGMPTGETGNLMVMTKSQSVDVVVMIQSLITIKVCKEEKVAGMMKRAYKQKRSTKDW